MQLILGGLQCLDYQKEGLQIPHSYLDEKAKWQGLIHKEASYASSFQLVLPSFQMTSYWKAARKGTQVPTVSSSLHKPAWFLCSLDPSVKMCVIPLPCLLFFFGHMRFCLAALEQGSLLLNS